MADVEIRPAATVMLLRDTPAGMDVFMLQRTHDAVFAPGAYVFPGGALDPADHAAEHRCAGRTDADASATLGVERGGLAYWVAAIRECFEEAGIMLARADADALRRAAKRRDDLNDGTVTFPALCDEEGLILDAGAIEYFGHFITPAGAPRRFDTRFFAVASPPDQLPVHEDRELIDSLWIRPSDALARWGDRLIPPTSASLDVLRRYRAVEDLMAALRQAPARSTQGTLL